MNRTTINILKGAAAVAVLLVITILVWGWLSEYRQAATLVGGNSSPTVDATGTAGETSASAVPMVVVVKIDGLNFRKSADETAKSIRGLKKGDKLLLLKKQGKWYQVRDTEGVIGWVSANAQYTKLEEK